MSCACRRRNAGIANSPSWPFASPAIKHIEIHGQKGYHGVAIVSRRPLASIASDFCNKGDARHLSVNLVARRAKPIELHNFYVPAGGDEARSAINPKFEHKLAFLDEMTDSDRSRDRISRRDLVGDINVAPLELDVWNHKALFKVVSHTPVEVETLECLEGRAVVRRDCVVRASRKSAILGGAIVPPDWAKAR